MTEDVIAAPSSGRREQVLVLMKGHPGTGKSTLAQCLCRLLEWPLIDKDATRDCLALSDLERQVPQVPGGAAEAWEL